MKNAFVGVLLALYPLFAADMHDRKVEPTFLHRYIPAVKARQADVATATCQYKPLFGAGDSQPEILHGVVRFGEITVAPEGQCNAVNYPTEEQAWVIMEGSGELKYAADQTRVTKHDFMYLPAGIEHGITNSGTARLRLFIRGFKVPTGMPPPPKLEIANLDEIKPQTVGGHPDSVVYQLMMGDTMSNRDRIAAGHRLVSLYQMIFEPNGTNFPHHHDNEEEIYILLDGTGDMVAGGGMDGQEGRHPAKPGDAYFFRLNCTVGFYNGPDGPAHILAVRSTYPRERHRE